MNVPTEPQPHGVVHRVYGVHEGRPKDQYFGAFHTIAEAQAEISRLTQRKSWVCKYHNQGFVIRQARVETDFQIPPRPKPRDRYYVSGERWREHPQQWEQTRVSIFRRPEGTAEATRIAGYNRNYALLQTFEPFRQGERELALISPNYTGTSVLDLATGEIIAAEPERPDGFCPVGFYVPDWWDLHSGRTIPGCEHWNEDHEWPNGDFGFVWGCIWGDDSSWKLQLLDLSQVQSGVIQRTEHFGYLELATRGYRSPCLQREPEIPPRGSEPPWFIRLSRHNGKTRVSVVVEMALDLDSGQPEDWKRLRNSNWE